MTIVRLFMICALVAWHSGAVMAADPQLIFVVRHAERADGGTAGTAMMAPSTDPPLSAAGHERAARLAAMLRSANIRNIFSTEYLRTRQTAAPTAQARHLETVSIPSKDLDALVAELRGLKGNVLVVGHSNTIPEVLKRLGIKDEIAIPEPEYDNLFIVVRPETGGPSLIRLRY